MSSLIAACVPPPERVDLDAAERQGFSQFGEEGVLERIFEIIPPTTRYAVEFGAYDGITHSNTRNLILKHGWGSLQIEGQQGRARKLARAYEGNPKVTTLQAWVFPGNVEILFEKGGVPKDLDLLVIDIDSNDYYVWRAIRDFRPKVVMIEANHHFPPPQLAVVEFHPMNYWDRTNYVGASIQSMVDLGKKKGYELIHVMRLGPNIIFVDAPYFSRFGIEDNSATAMWRPRSKIPPDPMSYPPGKQVLKVDAFTIPKKWVQDR
jgi:hypothetical protein